MENVLVTGASGFIGTNLIKELSYHSYNIWAIVRDENGQKIIEDLGLANVNIVICALDNIMELEKTIKNKIDAFYHLAWDGSAGEKRSDVKMQLQNIKYTSDCIELCTRLSCKRFIGAGSLMEAEAYNETTTDKRQITTANIYSAAKLMAHTVSKAESAQKEIEHIWCIITNAYGANEKSPRFINSCIKKMLQSEKLNLTSCEQNYDFIYVTDAARAIRVAGEKGEPFCSYVIGSGNAKPLKEFVVQMKENISPKAQLNFGGAKFDGIKLPLSAFDTSSLQNLGFEPEISFEQGIAKTIRAFEEN